MRLYTYSVPNVSNVLNRTAVETSDGRLMDINSAAASVLFEEGFDNYNDIASVLAPTNMENLIQSWKYTKDLIKKAFRDKVEISLDHERVLFNISEVKLRPPLLRPRRIHDFLVGKTHLINSLGSKIPENWYKFPVAYKGNPDAIFGPEDKIKKPRYTKKLDYELELGLIIGKKGIDINKNEAKKFIFGYTIFNDFSARDIQFEEMSVGLGPFKGKDFATSIGPSILIDEEIDPTKINLKATINGQIWSDGYLNDMQFSFSEIIEHLSDEEYIFPGDLIGSGTIGKGCGLELGKNIDVGDKVELSAEGVGILRNYIV